MNKIVDGVELLRMIRDGEVSSKTKIKSSATDFIYGYFGGGAFFIIKNDGKPDREMEISELVNNMFEILPEEDEKIDINSIEEFEFGKIEDETNYKTRSKINELIKAVKQLNKKIN